MKNIFILLFSLCPFLTMGQQLIDTTIINQELLVLDSFYQQQQYEVVVKRGKILLDQLADSGEVAVKRIRLLNRTGIALRDLGQYPESVALFQDALAIFEKFSIEDDELLAKTNKLTGTSLKFISDGNYLPYYQKAREIYIRLYGKQHPKVADIYTTLGEVALFGGQVQEARSYFEQSLPILKKHAAEYEKDLVRILYYYGSILADIGDYYQAETQLQLGLQLAKQHYGAQHFKTGICYAALGDCYRNMGKPQIALPYLEKNLAIQRKLFGEEHVNVSIAYNNLGHCYQDQEQYQLAYDFFIKALDIQKKVLDPFNGVLGDNYHILQECSFQLGALRDALKYGEKARDIFSYNWGNQHPQIASSYIANSKIYAALGDFSKAQQALQQSFAANNYIAGQEASILDPFNLLLSFQQQVALLQAVEPQLASKDTLLQIENVLLKALDFSEQLRTTFADDLSFVIVLDKIYPIYEQLLANYYQLETLYPNEGWAEKAFQYAELSKSRLLLQSFVDASAQQAIGIPDSIKQSEFNIRKERSDLENKRFQARKAENDSLFAALTTEVYLKKEEQQALLKQISTEYPNYYQLKYETPLVEVAEIQQTIVNEQTALVAYFMGDTFIFSFLITSSGVKMAQKDRPSSLKSTIQTWRNGFIQPNVVGAEAAKSELANLLWSSISPQITEATKHLIIIPDGVLAYLPFELLITPSEDYLSTSYSISYVLSAALLQQQTKREIAPATHFFAGFAPTYDQEWLANSDTIQETSLAQLVRAGQYDLAGAQQEVEQIAAYLNGTVYQAENATERIFKEQAGRYNILHLAMHALVEPNQPMFSKLLFTRLPNDSLEDNQLTANELYALSLNAELAVLSACNTGYGEIQRGEGSLSLSRAFAYAGVPATVTSLWKVPDQQTAEIMIEFYKNLKAGKNKAVALRDAKQTYLNKVVAPELRHPYYWAGFVLTGDSSPLTFSNAFAWWWLLLIGVLLFVGYFFLKNRKKM